jgi:alkylation response protein AidB-like acyl-CoA dehydrogenase
VNLDLTPEQEELRRTVRTFAEDVVAPRTAETDATGAFPLDVVDAMGRLGLFGIPFPTESGGRGAGHLDMCLAIEELARADSSVAITLAAGVGIGAAPIALFGSREQKERWLAPICRGQMLAGFGVTELGAGSDVAAMTTRARREGDDWVLDGRKSYITNSGTPITGFCTVAAVSGEAERGSEISMFVVPAGTKGFTVGRSYRKLGWRSSDTHELVFEGCHVPRDSLLGEQGRGLAQALQVLDGGRIGVAAVAVGLAQGCLDVSLDRAKDREAFGRPIGSMEAIQVKLADMHVGVETARLATWHAAWLRDEGRPFAGAAARAKLYSSEVAVACAREAVQIHGGSGFMDDSLPARFYRDSKILEIGEGTSEIQRLVIARDLGLPSPL